MKKILILFCCIFICNISLAQENNQNDDKILAIKYAPLITLPFLDRLYYNFEFELKAKKERQSYFFSFGYQEVKKQEVISWRYVGQKDFEVLNFRFGKRFYHKKQKKNLTGFYIQPEFRFFKSWGYREESTSADAIYEIDYNLKSYHLKTNFGYQNRLFNRLNLDFSLGTGLAFYNIDYEILESRLSNVIAYENPFFVNEKAILFNRHTEGKKIRALTIPVYALFSVGWAF